MTYIITVILLMAILFIYFVNKSNIVDNLKDTINIQIFNGLSILFVFIFIYYSSSIGLNNGIFTTFIIWCLFVVATPIPEAALLVSVPAKNFFNINLDITQLVVSFIVMVFIFYSYYNNNKLLKASSGGRFLIKIMDTKTYSIFVTSIVASISMAYLLNEAIDYIIYKKTIDKPQNIASLVVFIIFFIMYFVALYRLNK